MKKSLVVVLVLAVLVAFVGCTKEDTAFNYESIDKEWSIEIPKEYKEDKKESKDGFYYVSYRDENGGILSIHEVNDKDIVVNEESLEADLGDDEYLHMTRKETLDVEGIGKVYGGLIKDISTHGYMFYYKLRINDKVVNVLIFKKSEFTLEEEGEIKNMIGTIKKLK
ncbi:hypothetical protein R9X47_17455 [Wukongibacter baidiensis]|uniref:hypothetical protein n=1 Tax=Wukongibacter baidiensis TaxID=1723361 RepID=UPI003D7F2D7D